MKHKFSSLTSAQEIKDFQSIKFQIPPAVLDSMNTNSIHCVHNYTILFCLSSKIIKKMQNIEKQQLTN